MTITSGELLDTSIAQLRTLAAFLREQLDHHADSTAPAAAQIHACREVLDSLGVLILTLKTARETLTGTTAAAGLRQLPLASDVYLGDSHEA